MPVKVKINTTLGDTVVTLFNNAQIQNFEIDVIGNPSSINFDYGNWILKSSQFNITDVKDLSSPFQYELKQNYPNPFNPATTIDFQLPDDEFTILKVYDINGREVSTLVDEYKSKGKYKIKFHPTNLSSGIYYYSLRAGNFFKTHKMLFLK